MSRLESFTPKADHGHAHDASAALSADYHDTMKSRSAAAPAHRPLEVAAATAPGAQPAEASLTPAAPPTTAPTEVAAASPAAAAAVPSDLAPLTIGPGPASAAPIEMPAPVQQAIAQGNPVRFSTASENQDAGRQPDYFMGQDGQLVKNENAQPSPDGSINIQMQGATPDSNKSLREAIIHQSDMQRQAAQEMIRLYQKNHPGQPVPSWMTDLATAKPNVPDFTPFDNKPNQQASPAPENGFQNRNVGHGNSAGFAGNGGFDGNGMFRGNGSAGDGTLNTGATDSRGQPLGPGETVQAKAIYDYLTDKYQLSPAVASGILGNMMTESSLRTDAHNHAEGAIGLVQWEGPRRTQLEHFAAAEGKPVTDWHVQVDFMMHELKGSESGAFARLQQAETPKQAAAIFDQYFERSSGEARGQRMANAENIYHHVATAAPAPTPSKVPMA